MRNSECGVQNGEPEGKGRWLDSVGLGLTWLDLAGPSFSMFGVRCSMFGVTIERAKGQVYTDNKGVTNVVQEPAPEYYALLPFAVSLDVVTFPFMLIGGYVCLAITG